MDMLEQIEVVENIGHDEFNERFFLPQKPVVIRGLAKGTIADQKWSIDYFKDTMGDIDVDVLDNNNKKSSTSAYTSPDLKMKFSDYLGMLKKNENTNYRIFLFNLFKFNPKLKNEFPCPKIFNGILDNTSFMFFGGRETTVRIHYDIDMSSVLHTHFGGRKRVVLIPPKYGKLLYCLPMNTYSLIDLDHPDYEKYPGLKYIKGYDFILESGDTLFMPSGYWHYMTYLDGSFSVSYRKIAPSFRLLLEGIFNLGILIPLDKLLNRVLNQKWLEIKIHLAEKRANRLLAAKRMIA